MRRIGAALATFLLAACATPYHASSPIGGYKDKKLGPQTYQVTFTANLYTSSQRMENVLLLRASEVTLKEGYDKFVVLNTQTNDKSTVAYGGAAIGPVSISYPVGVIEFRTLKADASDAATGYDAASTKARIEPLVRKRR